MQTNHTTETAPVKPKLAPKLTVTEAARILGVTRVHLSYVKHGHRRSPKLLIRYQALQHHQSIAA